MISMAASNEWILTRTFWRRIQLGRAYYQHLREGAVRPTFSMISFLRWNMQDAFRDIERGHEAKYKLDEELRFKAQCRRTRLLGHWVARRIGMAPEEADSYAKRLVALNLERPGTAHIAAKVLADLDEAGVAANETDVSAAIEQFYAQALASLAENFPEALDRDHVQVGG